MSSSRRSSTPRPLHATALGLGLLLASSTPALSQVRARTVATSTDSTSWVAKREPLERAEALLQTRDRHSALLLTDTTLVLQLTNAGLDRVAESMDEQPAKSTGQKILMDMLGAGIVGLLNHGIVYRLSALREARVEGNSLVLVGRDGKRIFENVELNGRQVMDDFTTEEAERFAAAVNRAIRSRTAR